MAIPSGGKGSPIEPGLIQRLSGAMRYAITGNKPEWFGPMEPIAPVVPANETPSVTGRQFDYPVGYNTRIKPRQEEAVSFAQMRALADSYDIMRLIIETRKDQMSKLKWSIKYRDDKKKIDSRCQAIQDFLQLPDQEHTWNDWLRMLLEDLFVIDAPTVYVRPTVGGKLYALEPLDGATIKRVIDEFGRTPDAPEPAYQQILHGVPAVDYTRDELIYRPRNLRTHKVYGYSPVEQVIMTVNIALRRQFYQLAYYTEGNVPEALASVPKEWNPDQIAQFQAYWDDINSGDLAERRHLKFIPDGLNFKETKAPPLKDEYDEWLARVICFAFSVAPTPFIKQQNRATAESAHDAALEEGLAPIMQWVKGLIDYIVIKYFNAPDIEFAWSEEESLDPLEQAKIFDMRIRNGSLLINESRAFYGDEPVDGGDEPIIITASGAITLKDALEQAANPPPPPPMMAPHDPNAPPSDGHAPQDDGHNHTQPTKKPPATAKEAVAKAKKSVQSIDRDRPVIDKIRKKLQTTIQKFLKEQSSDISAQVIKAMGEVGKSEQDEIQKIMDRLNFAGLVVLAGDIQPILEALARQGGMDALIQIEMADDERMVNLVNEAAVKYSKSRSAEMVGMKRDDNGDLIPNPNEVWQIDESTREMLRTTITQAMEEGWSNDTLASEIEANHAFSSERSEIIARTETAFADVQGNMDAYRASEVVAQKQWITGEGCCELCAALDGVVVDLDEDFDYEDGPIDAPPAHPQCFLPGTKVSAVDVSVQYKRRFVGKIAVIGIGGDDDLTVTPNHPILTDAGWVAAGKLKVGDKLVKCIDPGTLSTIIDPQHNHVVSLIEDVASALLMSGPVLRATMPSSAVDFHGDGVANSEVSVVWANRTLPDDIAVANEFEHDSQFGERHFASPGNLLNTNGFVTETIERGFATPNGFMSGASDRDSAFGAGVGHSELHGFAAIPCRESHDLPSLSERGAMASDSPSYINTALAGHVTFVEVEHVGLREYDGHVFNLQTSDGWYLANGIVAHNCRCDLLPVLNDDSNED